jgi:cyclomaltodextrinase
MHKASLDRRSFLRLCTFTAGGAVLASCQQTLFGRGAERVRLIGSDQDAWMWVKPVTVEVSDECERVIVHANGQAFESRPDGGGFSAEIRLAAGENEVSAVCQLPNGREIRSDPVKYTVRLRQVPRAVIAISLNDGSVSLSASESSPADDEFAIVDYIWSSREGNPAPLRTEGGELTGEVNNPTITLVPPSVDGEYYVQLRVIDSAGREDSSVTYFVVDNGQPRIPNYATEHPTWVDKAIVYGVIPFLYGSPAFQALRERLDDLADLGINALWLGPINKHPADDYGYAVEDYFGLDPAYGTQEDFRGLVQAAHERGIRVLMDFVPNHSSDTHPYFVDTREHGPESPYWDFYDRDAEGNPTHYFDWTNLPNLNYDNPQVRQMMIEAFAYWVREFDVDGFRVDVAWGIEERHPDFWPEWRHELKRIKPDLLLLAEATARESFYFENGFDAAYDWTYQPGAWSWKVAWETYKFRLLAYNLTDALTNRPEGFHPDAVVFRFLNNNDTGRRFITRYGEAATRVATAMLLTLPGIPCIYTGDEYGLEFEPYQQVEPLDFVEQYPELRGYHKRLIALRKAHRSLYSRNLIIIKPDAMPQTVFSYIRYSEAAEAPVVVLLNFSEEPAVFEFDIPGEASTLAGRDTLYDLLAEESIQASAGNRIRIAVPAQTARVLAEAPVE